MADKKPAKPVTLDFSDVEGGRRNCPDGQYNLEVVAIEEKESSTGNPYWSWKWKIADGEYKGVTLYDNTSLQPQALWRLRGLLECLGVNITGKMKLDPSKYIKRKLQADVVNETYQGKTRPKIAEFIGPARAAEESSSEFSVGDQVNITDDDEVYTGKIKSLQGGKAIVLVESEDGSTEEWEVSEKDLDKVAA